MIPIEMMTVHAGVFSWEDTKHAGNVRRILNRPPAPMP